MSSRGQLVGSGPGAGIYQPRPTPPDAKDMPTYLNDELLDLGGRLNNVLEGGVFPPQAKLPKRYKDGMVIFFTEPVKDDKGVEVISSSGVWLYKDKKWWKIIDDPTAMVQNLQVYMLVPAEAGVPSKPPADKYIPEDLNGWVYTPSENMDGFKQYTSVAPFAELGEPVSVKWSKPVAFNTAGGVGSPGENGSSIDIKYIASTVKPSIKDRKVLNPTTMNGEPYLDDIPQPSHPEKDYIWSIVASIKGDEIEFDGWSDPSRFSTPDSTQLTVAYAVSRYEVFPDWNPGEAGLPGPEWFPKEPEIPPEYILWRTERLEWTDGSAQSEWSYPIRFNSVSGLRTESRYIASTVYPEIDDDTARYPTSISFPFSMNIPNTSPPDKSSIWITTATIDRFDELDSAGLVAGKWSSPAKLATPDSLQYTKAFGLGTSTNFPDFNPDADGLPSPEWTLAQPEIPTGEYLWITERQEWTNGDKNGPWSFPIRFTPVDSISFETRYIASTVAPQIPENDRFPAGWSLDIPPYSHPDQSFIWASTAKVDSGSDELLSSWSTPVKYATPDATSSANAYYLGEYDTNPPYNPDAEGLPGKGWSKENMTPPKGKCVWHTDRFIWIDGTALTSWTPPTVISGYDGEDGTSNEMWFIEMTGKPLKPVAYPPGGDWSKETPENPATNVWMSNIEKSEQGSPDLLSWTFPIKVSGTDGLAGPEGPMGPAGQKGDDGAQGGPGPAGPIGPKGEHGENGADGAQGPAGPAGPRGNAGPQGPAGAIGPSGPVGPKGDQGLQGGIGPQGPTGPRGATGPQGAGVQMKGRKPLADILGLTDMVIGDLWVSTTSGSLNDGISVAVEDSITYTESGWINQGRYTGPQGEVGATGPAGPVGPKGSAGATGPVGPSGATGPKGDKGDEGEKGKFGKYGAVGPTGPSGPRGAQGDKGGLGPQGPAGVKGADGAQGPAGPAGPRGSTGATGAQGPAGPAGPKGSTGATGPTGAQGPAGADGKSISNNSPIMKSPTATNYNGSISPQVFPTQYIDDWRKFDMAKADAWIKQHANRDPLEHDVVIQADSFEYMDGYWITAQVVRHYNIESKKEELWWYTGYNTFFGDLIVDGTIIGSKIVANTITGDLIKAGTLDARTIKAGAITGDKIQANTSISSPNIIGGQLNIGSGRFTVSTAGELRATGANIGGHIEATSMNASNITGLAMKTNGLISGGHLHGAKITCGKQFSVTSEGKMTCTGAEVNGNIRAVTLNADAVGTLNLSAGTINGGTVSGTNLKGGTITVPATGDRKFYVDSSGNMICNNATVQGTINSSNFNNGNIRGGTLGIGPGGPYNGYHTYIDSVGNLFCDRGEMDNIVIKENCTIKGKIDASAIAGDVPLSRSYSQPKKEWHRSIPNLPSPSDWTFNVCTVTIPKSQHSRLFTISGLRGSLGLNARQGNPGGNNVGIRATFWAAFEVLAGSSVILYHEWSVHCAGYPQIYWAETTVGKNSSVISGDVTQITIRIRYLRHDGIQNANFGDMYQMVLASTVAVELVPQTNQINFNIH